MLGDVQSALGRTAEAQRSYETALHLAQTIAPEFQVGWVDQNSSASWREE